MPKQHYKFTGLGKRKTAVARVYMNEGKGTISVNDREFEDYFSTSGLQRTVGEPFVVTESQGRFDLHVRVRGGGISGQAEAVRHGVARALLQVDPEFRTKLKTAGLLTRDARKKERKKYGQPGARKRFQYSKR